jgi:outer membrane protein TolC
MLYKLKTFIPILATLLASCLITSAQSVGNKPGSDSNATVFRSYIAMSDTVVENRLVELAMQSPLYSASNHQIKVNELDLKRAKNSWLNLLSISTNYNDQSFAKTNTATPVVYPKYFLGVTIPLGVIFSQGNQVKTAKEAVGLGKDQQEQLRRSIKADILSKYRQYRLYSSMIEMQSELINDVLANADQAEKDFKKGTITVESYISSIKTKNEELGKNMNLQFQQDLVKLEIEKIIGVPLESVLQLSSTPSGK